MECLRLLRRPKYRGGTWERSGLGESSGVQRQVGRKRSLGVSSGSGMTWKLWTCICPRHTLERGCWEEQRTWGKKTLIFGHERCGKTIEHPGAERQSLGWRGQLGHHTDSCWLTPGERGCPSGRSPGRNPPSWAPCRPSAGERKAGKRAHKAGS